MTAARCLVTLLTIASAYSSVSGNVDEGPPRIVSFPAEDLDGKNATTNHLRIECKATGKGIINYSWKKFKINDRNHEETLPPDLKVERDGSLVSTYSVLLPSTEGYYQCFVSNSLGTIFSRKVKVRVKSVSEFLPTKPVIIGDPTPGTILLIKCPALRDGPGYGVIRVWGYVDTSSNSYFQLPTIYEVGEGNKHRILKSNGNLVLSPLKNEDCKFFQEEVKCKAEAGNRVEYSQPVSLSCKSGSSSTQQNVAPSWAESLPSKQVAFQGKKHTMACAATGVPVPDITWYKGDLQIVDGKNDYSLQRTHYMRILSIDKVDRAQHEGTYKCVARSKLGAIESDSTLKVLVQPTITEEIPAIEIKLQTNSSLVCKASGIPTPRISWWYNGENITNLLRRTIKGNVLKFHHVELTDSGVYQCVAENEAGMAVSGTHVIVTEKAPTFDTFGPFPMFLKGTGTLKCENDAAPPAHKFIWYKGTAPVTISGRYSMDSKGTLTIRNVEQSDDGTYRCEATNTKGSKMSNEAPAILYDETVISTKPQNTVVEEGTNMNLRCQAKKDKRLEIKYKWIKDGAELRPIDNPNNRIFWNENKNLLQIRNVINDDSGRYSCIAYTPGPFSEARATAIAEVAGVPEPPTNLNITNCTDFNTTISWTTQDSRESPITNFLVELESSLESGVFRLLKNVTDPQVNSTELILPAWATLRFRVRAVNSFGASRGSEPTTTECKTKERAPTKYPDNFTGVAGKANELDITWTPLTKLEQSAPGCKYHLQLRRKDSGNEWKKVEIPDPKTSVYKVENAGYYILWEFQIWAHNAKGKGPSSPILTSYSGQDPPDFAPAKLRDIIPGPRSVRITWDEVKLEKDKIGSIDNYRIFYYPASGISARRKRRSTPKNPGTSDVSKDAACSDGKCSYEFKGFKPYTEYKLTMRALNSGGVGPPSEEISFKTLEDAPSAPVNLQAISFGKYILMKWSPPEEKNGVMEAYYVGIVSYTGNQMLQPKPKLSTKLNADQFEHLFSSLTYTSKYVVGVAGKTGANNLGTGAYLNTLTLRKLVPAQPDIPTVYGTSTSAVNVTFKYGLGGGYPTEFRIQYREKVLTEDNKETPYKNSTWQLTSKQRWVIIDDLTNTLHEFRAVGRNEEGFSPPSDTVEERPLTGIGRIVKEKKPPFYKELWFIILVCALLLVLIIFILLAIAIRNRGAKYPVRKREKARAGMLEDYQDEDELSHNDDPLQTEKPPPYGTFESPEKRSEETDSDKDSMQFNENGSFIVEYGTVEKKPQPAFV